MSLNLNDRPERAVSAYGASSAFNDAVNDSQFVRSFGFVALACSILIPISAAIGIGVGAAVAGFGSSTYYRILGISVVVMSLIGFWLGPLVFVSGLALGAGVAYKGVDILGVLTGEDKADPDFQTTLRRALIGIFFSSAGALLSSLWLILSTIHFLFSRA
jgi:hypothetical protein